MSNCNHNLLPHQKLAANAGFDGFELALLNISRLFFAAFSDPEKRLWTTAFALAKQVWGPVHGPALANGLVEVLDAMRITRRETFRFSNPLCQCCNAKLSDHERQLMACVCSARRGDRTRLNASAIMLFNGQEPHVFIAALDEYIGMFALGVLSYDKDGGVSTAAVRALQR